MTTFKEDYKRVHIFVSGKVQGVYYRQNTLQTAQQLQVSGWVRNLKDGRVEAMLEGKQENVNKLLEWCKIGPKNAEVDDIQIINEAYMNEFSSFEIIDSP